MEKIVIVGSANTDLIVRADGFRHPARPFSAANSGSFPAAKAPIRPSPSRGWAATPFSWRVSGPTFSEMN